MIVVVTQPVDPFSVDIEDTYTEGDKNFVSTYTLLKVDYIARLNTEKDWLTADVAEKQASITVCNARSIEIDTIITAVNNL